MENLFLRQASCQVWGWHGEADSVLCHGLQSPRLPCFSKPGVWTPTLLDMNHLSPFPDLLKENLHSNTHLGDSCAHESLRSNNPEGIDLVTHHWNRIKFTLKHSLCFPQLTLSVELDPVTISSMFCCHLPRGETGVRGLLWTGCLSPSKFIRWNPNSQSDYHSSITALLTTAIITVHNLKKSYEERWDYQGKTL